MTTRISFNLDNKVKSRLNLISKKRNIDESELVNIFFTKIFEIWESKVLDFNSDFVDDVDLDFISLSDLSEEDLVLLERSKKSKNRINI